MTTEGIMAEQSDLINLDFEGVEAQDSDVPSMTRLLNQLVRESGVDPTQLANVLVSQNYIGSVLKPSLDDVDFDDDEDPEDQAVYAITSVVNLSDRKEPVIKDVFQFVRKYIQEKKVKLEKGNGIFQKVMKGDGLPDSFTLGLFIKERMVNMPLELLHPSLLSLVDDMERAREKNMPYKFTHYMYWSKMYLDNDTFHHVDEEDDWFDKNAVDYFSYPLQNADKVMVEDDSDSEGATPYRRLYIFEASKLESFIEYVN